MEKLPIFAIERYRMTTDGDGVTTLVGAYGCPLQCRYCLNPHAWNPETLKKCTYMSASELYERVKIDDLYFQATGGGVTFGGGEGLLHADFIKEFRKVCGNAWRLTVETSLNVKQELLQKAIEAVDAFIVDIKDLNPSIYENYTGKGNEQVLSNLAFLAKYLQMKQVRIRVPFIPDFNTKEDMQSSVEKLQDMGFRDIEVFSYIVREKK
ncbi:MAG: radical SAM protein [Lachnospiraceae bacterium]|nr:radical SAM protein [Lachnospiraceae bacterium]